MFCVVVCFTDLHNCNTGCLPFLTLQLFLQFLYYIYSLSCKFIRVNKVVVVEGNVQNKHHGFQKSVVFQNLTPQKTFEVKIIPPFPIREWAENTKYKDTRKDRAQTVEQGAIQLNY